MNKALLGKMMASKQAVRIVQDIRPKQGGPPVGPKLITRGDAPMTPYSGSLPTFKNPCPE